MIKNGWSNILVGETLVKQQIYGENTGKTTIYIIFNGET